MEDPTCHSSSSQHEVGVLRTANNLPMRGKKSPFSERTVCTVTSTSHGAYDHDDDGDHPGLPILTAITPTSTVASASVLAATTAASTPSPSSTIHRTPFHRHRYSQSPLNEQAQDSMSDSHQFPSNLFDKLDRLELRWSRHKRQSSVCSSAFDLEEDCNGNDISHHFLLNFDDSASLLSLDSCLESSRRVEDTFPVRPALTPQQALGRGQGPTSSLSPKSQDPVISIPSNVLDSIQRRRLPCSPQTTLRNSSRTSQASSRGTSVFDRLYQDARQRATRSRRRSLQTTNSNHNNTSLDDSFHSGSWYDPSLASSTVASQRRTRNGSIDSDSVFERLYRGDSSVASKQRRQRRRQSFIPTPKSGSPSFSYSSLDRRLSYQPPAHVTPRRPSSLQPPRASRLLRGDDQTSRTKTTVFERLYRNEARPSRRISERQTRKRSRRSGFEETHNRSNSSISTEKECFGVAKDYRGVRQYAIRCQKMIRGYIVRTSMKQQHTAAEILQQGLRNHLAARQSVRGSSVFDSQSSTRALSVRNVPCKALESSQQAASTIQTWWRSSVIRMQFLSLRYCAVLIQHAYRQYRLDLTEIEGVNVCRRKQSEGVADSMQSNAILIQAWYRSLMIRREYLCLHYCSILIQATYRGYTSRKQTFAVCQVQNFGRAIAYGSRFQRERQAAIALQRTYKSYLTRQNPGAFRKLGREDAAATKIQAQWRASQRRIEFVWLRWQVIVLQSFIREKLLQRRGHILPHRISNALQRDVVLGIQPTLSQHEAARRIQAWWRMTSTESGFSYMRLCAIVIQRSCRQYRLELDKALLDWNNSSDVKGEYFDSLSTEKHAVILQSWFRALRDRKTFQEQRSAATRIEACVRGLRSKTDFRARREGAVLITKVFRGFLVRRNNLMRREAVVVVQRIWRDRCRRHNMQKDIHKTRLFIATTLQRYYRGKREREDCLKIVTASSVIQKKWRNFVVKRNWISNLRHKSAATIQAHARRFICHRVMETQIQALLIIQRYFRGFVILRRVREMHLKATTVQKLFRGWSLRTSFRERCLAEREEMFSSAAILLQAHYRGYAARYNFMIKNGAVLMVQCFARKALASRVGRQLREKRSAASVTKLQSHIRRYLGSANFRVLRLSCLLVQRVFRGVSVRREIGILTDSTQVLQRVYRGYAIRCRTSAWMRGATKIQALFRGFVARSRAHRRIIATICLQTYSRAFLARRDFMLAAGALLILQSCFRRHLALIAMRQGQYQRRLRSAILVQKTCRGAIVRRYKRAEASAAICIQRLFRGHTSRLWMMRSNDSAFGVQRIWCGYRARRFLTEAKRGVLCLQKHWRGAIARSRFTLCRGAVVMIQCNVRRFVARGAFHRRQHQLALLRLSAAVKLQACARRLQVCRWHKEIAESSLVLQRFTRGMLVRQHMQANKDAATLLQSVARVRIARVFFMRIRDSVAFIQRGFRRKILKRKSGATKIQAVIRSRPERARFLRISRATKIIQSQYRLGRQRSLVSKLKSSSVLLRKSIEGKLSHSVRLYALLQINGCLSALASLVAISEDCRRQELSEKILTPAKWGACILIQSAFRRHRCQVYAVRERSMTRDSSNSSCDNQAWYSRVYNRREVAVKVVEKLGPHRVRVEFCRMTYVRQTRAAKVLQRFARSIGAK